MAQLIMIFGLSLLNFVELCCVQYGSARFQEMKTNLHSTISGMKVQTNLHSTNSGMKVVGTIYDLASKGCKTRTISAIKIKLPTC